MKNPMPLANPYGPYFKEIDIQSILKAKQNEIEFKTSTLENKHVWQLHLGNDLGLKLDLVDQNAFLNDDPKTVPPLSAEDKIFTSTDLQSNSRGKANGRTGNDQNLPQFFRQTVYMDNDPFHQRNKNHNVNEFAKTAAVKKKMIDQTKDILSPDFIEEFFSLVDRPLERLVKENAKKRKLLWSKPLLPEDTNNNITRMIVRFTEDPAFSLGYPTADAVLDGEENTKRFRIEESIFMNARASKDVGDESRNKNITLVAPSINDESEETCTFEWVKDYEMDIQDSNLKDSYIISLKDSSDQAIYFPLKLRLEMKKLAIDHSQPHKCTVTRSED